MSQKKPILIIAVALFLTTCCTDQSAANETAFHSPTPDTLEKQSEREMQQPGVIINEEGWTVPRPNKFKRGRTDSREMNRSDGKMVEAIFTTMEFDQEIHFSLNSIHLSVLPEAFSGKLRLLQLREIATNAKVFGYVILAEPEDQRLGISANHHKKRPFYFALIDGDGDGIFEALYLSLADLSIPQWI